MHGIKQKLHFMDQSPKSCHTERICFGQNAEGVPVRESAAVHDRGSLRLSEPVDRVPNFDFGLLFVLFRHVFG